MDTVPGPGPYGPPDGIELDAIVLAGGRGSRLGGIDKAALTLDGKPLLDRALDAVDGVAGTVVVVGPERVLASGEDAARITASRSGTDPAGAARLRTAREDPPYGGPAAATAAGLAALDPDRDGDAWVLLLSCDLVHPAAAVAALVPAVRTAAREAGTAVDAVVGVDPDGRRQPLTAVYRRRALVAAVAELVDSGGGSTGASMRALIAPLTCVDVLLTRAESADVDTVEDALRTGVRLPDDPTRPPRPEEDA
ncbi:hypothetical protein GCM10011512_01250 [Tersicoccus solisilvae]|uniref:MobA-like NTP transferase domain-containing protein n=1 Tax=Tersicoccus solisilvae TaxID=1882339 RepID=A0ABQ1NJ03_9MICC|nr:NTP transferase domain-containing protein [Tersicoccus solisilvae]GGC78428.1 hypothetical protein GCM10011512_01250 [Tersicoccus solisilvae]